MEPPFMTLSRWYILLVVTNPRSEDKGSLCFFRHMMKSMWEQSTVVVLFSLVTIAIVK